MLRCRFFMGLRKTSTQMPPTSMVSRLVLTLVLHYLEDLIRASLIGFQLLAYRVADFSLLELVAAPIVLSGVTHGGVHANRRRLVLVQVIVERPFRERVYRVRI